MKSTSKVAMANLKSAATVFKNLKKIVRNFIPKNPKVALANFIFRVRDIKWWEGTARHTVTG